MMLRPFEPFKAIYIPKLLELKRYWLVSQTYQPYNNHFTTEAKTNLLFTDYDDGNMAREHLRSLTADKYAALLNLQNPLHKAKVLELVGAHSRFHVSWAVIKRAKELENKLNHGFKEKMRRYIGKNTNWRISRDSFLQPSLQVILGELFIILKYGGQTLKIKFEELETA
ncbi:MAG TPA: hypothetical protein VGM41_21840 [Chitinophagaceae bacterium]